MDCQRGSVFCVPSSSLPPPHHFHPFTDFSIIFFFPAFFKWKANSLGQQLRARGRAQSKPPPPFKGSGVAKLGSPCQLTISSLIKRADEESLHRHPSSSRLLPSSLPPAYLSAPSCSSPLAVTPVTFPINTRPGRENPS